ncbi:hypothetical protein G7074_25800 [Pedobacter sp. HDW13]|uniref:hypothetical protein n=1 Tax=Pedobacter sp. HDW13 TaxID=2714940 RepID=UPI001407275D|nr:hypothetical protein [Pedobacter sp. HDW13]QIL42373.1 hypothetical protein G7074_25800 [Pedobacter sp. HDW13]
MDNSASASLRLPQSCCVILKRCPFASDFWIANRFGLFTFKSTIFNLANALCLGLEWYQGTKNMPIIEFISPLISKGIDNPAAIANKGFPYRDIADPRRLEELVYSIFEAKITKGTLSGFDKVSLMSGVRDMGRDCALFQHGILKGMIQCKKYQKSISKTDFGEEIVKYVLYSLLEPQLIPDARDFTYYIAATGGFVRDCSDLIDEFNIRICQEPDLNNWMQKLLLNPTLSDLKIADVDGKVKDILKQIKVLKIHSQDLDAYLMEQECRHLISLFFEVRTVTDNAEIEALRSDFSGYFNRELNESGIREELSRGSSALSHQRNEFDDIPDSHIPRSETAELLQWIKTVPEKDKFGNELNLCVLAGNAGMGKTVILKDLYEQLKVEGIAVLGLKADRLYAASLPQLQGLIGISLPLFDFIEQCKQRFVNTVIIIDQIDALSQTMSSDRNFLTVYKSLIDNYAHDASVRIVFSVRFFDLYYDPSLRQYKNIKTISVKPLAKEQVLEQLKKIGVFRERVSVKLMELLCTPNHLNVFSRIADALPTDESIISIQGLYTELWRQKVLSIPANSGLEIKRVKKLLYKIAKEMFKAQRISLNVHLFEEDSREISFLESQRLLKREGQQIQFFHQTFYDFVFAKRFVEKGDDLISYIKLQEQSIFVRSAVKMIMGYLRDFDFESYISILSKLLNDKEIFFHFRHMSLLTLASLESPEKSEVDLIEGCLSKSFLLSGLFFQQVRSVVWFDELLVRGSLDLLTTPLEKKAHLFEDLDEDPLEWEAQFGFAHWAATRLLIAHMNNSNPLAWDFAERVTDQALLRNLAFGLNLWEHPGALQLLGRCEDFINKDQFGFYSVLEKMAKTHPQVVIDKMQFLISTRKTVENGEQRERESVLKKLAGIAPEKLIDLLFVTVSAKFNKRNILNDTLISDYTFDRIDLREEEHLDSREFLYRLLAICLRRAAAKNDPEFLAFVKKHGRSKQKAVLRLIIFALKSNEGEFQSVVYNLFLYLQECGHIKLRDDFGVEYRELLESAFPLLGVEMQDYICNAILNLKVGDEIWIDKGWDKPVRRGKFGLSKYVYLCRLPRERVFADTLLKRSFLELERKFVGYKDTSNLGSVMAGMVTRPLPAKAYQNMTKKEWIKSFRKYASERDPFSGDYLKGGLEEHTWGFRDAVKSCSSEMIFDIIETVISDTSIPVQYAISGLLGLSEQETDRQRCIYLLKKVIAESNYDGWFWACADIAGNLVGGEEEDQELIDLLVEAAFDVKEKEFEANEAETDIGGLVTRGINTIHGRAARSLVEVKDKRFADQVFNALNLIFKEGPKESKAAVLYRYACLNHLDQERSYKLFLKTLVDEDDVFLLASSLWSLQYMGNHDFKGLYPIFEKLANAKNLGRDDSQFLVSILYFSHLYDRVGAGELLLTTLEKNQYAGNWLLNLIIKHVYHDDGSKRKSLSLLEAFFSIGQPMSPLVSDLSFVHAEHLKVEDVSDFLMAYISSAEFRLGTYLIKYLTAQCGREPFICVELFHKAMAKRTDVDPDRGVFREDDDTTKFIVGAFNSIRGNDRKSKETRKILLQSFDMALMDYKRRGKTEEILEELV